MNTCDIKVIRRKKNKKEKIVVALITVILLAMIIAPIVIAVNRQNNIEENYNRSIDMALLGDYEGAAKKLEELNRDWYKDALAIKNYCRACICREKGLLLNAKFACENLTFEYLDDEQIYDINSVIEKINAESKVYSEKIDQMWEQNAKVYYK